MPRSYLVTFLISQSLWQAPFQLSLLGAYFGLRPGMAVMRCHSVQATYQLKLLTQIIRQHGLRSGCCPKGWTFSRHLNSSVIAFPCSKSTTHLHHRYIPMTSELGVQPRSQLFVFLWRRPFQPEEQDESRSSASVGD